jgi:hypothetical protein
MTGPGASRHATSIPSASRRAVILIVAALLAVHSLLVALWVMPSNPVREAAGDERVSSYINNDYVSFEQAWSIFAPVPRRADENVQVRATLGRPEDGRSTRWFDITADEDRRIEHLVNPSRIHSATHRLGGSINAMLRQLNPGQRRIVAGRASSSTSEDLRHRLVEANTAGPAGLKDIDRYLMNEEMLVRFGTMYAVARWGDGVSAVEFKVGHRAVPTFDHRHVLQVGEVPFTYSMVGRRTATRPAADAQKAFDGYVVRASASDVEDG